jgi:hypothetical protein
VYPLSPKLEAWCADGGREGRKTAETLDCLLALAWTSYKTETHARRLRFQYQQVASIYSGSYHTKISEPSSIECSPQLIPGSSVDRRTPRLDFDHGIVLESQDGLSNRVGERFSALPIA